MARGVEANGQRAAKRRGKVSTVVPAVSLRRFPTRRPVRHGWLMPLTGRYPTIKLASWPT